MSTIKLILDWCCTIWNIVHSIATKAFGHKCHSDLNSEKGDNRDAEEDS